jgi:hypothetical protein
MGDFYRRRIAFVLTLLLICASMVNAQVTTASMNGIVTDKSGQPLVGASVRVIHEPSGTQYGTSTRDDGRYNLRGLRVGGPYIIKLSFIGYKTQERKGIRLELGQDLKVDFTLLEEAVQTEEVTIIGESTSILSASHTGATSNVSRLDIDKLPTINRSFSDFLKLSPYFIGNSAQGRSYKYNNIQIDGANFNDLFGLGSTGMPGVSNVAPISMEAIQEFQVSVSPFDVRQTGFTGAGINAITRSGSNDLSGAAFIYGRNQNLVGKSPDASHSSYADFGELQAGFRLGGSIIKDNLFYFASGEFTAYKRPISRIFGASATGTNLYTASQDSIDLFVNTLKERYGYDPGSFTNINNYRRSAKMLVRFDYNIDENNKLTLRDNFMTGYDDAPPSFGGVYGANTMYQNVNTTNSLVAQMTSVLNKNMSNELIVGYTLSRDRPTYYGQEFPMIEIYSMKDNTGGSTNLFSGAENYRIKNALDQDVIEITDNFTYFLGDHTFTVGTHNEIFWFKNLYIANADGFYNYNYLADFVNEKSAYQYQLSYSLTGDPNQAAKFKAIQYGLYAQDDWNVLPNLKITAGVRIDIPTLPDKPAYNYKFDSTFSAKGYDLSTSAVPSGQMMYSPRAAFNYDVFGDRTTQIRGGTGLFTGRVPYVWISNQYGNTGVEFARLNMYSSATTQLILSATDPLKPLSGATVATTEVDVTAKNFKMPQVWRSSLGVDQQLPFGFVGTIEGVWTYTLNDIMYQDVNLRQVGLSAIDGRPFYGTYNATSRRWTYVKQNSTNFTNVILLSNTSQGYSENITIQLQRANAEDGINANIAYTYGVSKDMNSGNSSQAASQWKYNHAVDPNNPTLGFSQYDRRHRVMVNVSYRYEWAEDLATSIGLYYSGLSGQPYSWIINGDINGDQQTSNDLAYIPKDANDIILVSSSNAVITDKNDAAYTSLFNFLNKDSYLSGRKGQIAERMAAHTIWSGQIDLHIGQEIPIIPGHNIEVLFDILNVMNLIDKDMGWIKYVSNQAATNLLTFYAYDASGQPMYKIGSLNDPSIASDLASRWQMQLGIRYSF